jgi:HSP20 family protein
LKGGAFLKRDIAPYKGFFGSNSIEEFFNNNFLSNIPTNIRSNIKETNREYILEAELPGFDKQDINIEWHDGYLHIAAQQNKDIEEQQETYLRKERYSGAISRTYRVEGIQADQINAEYNNGILKVIMPKSEEYRDKRRIIDIN